MRREARPEQKTMANSTQQARNVDGARRMIQTLSPDTQAILLLTAPLLAGRARPSSDLLSPGGYKRLARRLREIQRRPADLVASDSGDVLRECNAVIPSDRLERLLSRGFLLTQAVERWQSRAIWVMSRADAEYPRQLKDRLRDDAPALLYGCGDHMLVGRGGLAVVGSRNADDWLLEYSARLGRLAAGAGLAVVSGGAKGVDLAAMRGALLAGGVAVGVLADSLEKAAMNRDNRASLMDGRLVLCSPHDPGAGFNVGNAMQRNKVIYALSDAALVANADLGKGGTWSGAVEQLEKLRLVPIYVRSAGSRSAGLDGLRAKGGLPWPESLEPEGLRSFLRTDGPRHGLAADPSLFDDSVGSVGDGDTTRGLPAEAMEVRETAESAYGESIETTVESRPDGSVDSAVDSGIGPAETLFAAAREAIMALLSLPMKDNDVAEALGIQPVQARAWLQRLLEEGVIERKTRPAGYVRKQHVLFQ